MAQNSWPEEYGSGAGYGGQEDGWAAILAGCDPPSVLQPPEHDLDVIAVFVATLVIADGFGSLRPGIHGKPQACRSTQSTPCPLSRSDRPSRERILALHAGPIKDLKNYRAANTCIPRPLAAPGRQSALAHPQASIFTLKRCVLGKYPRTPSEPAPIAKAGTSSTVCVRLTMTFFRTTLSSPPAAFQAS